MGVMNSDSHHDSYILTFMNKFPSHAFQVKFTHDPNLGTRSRPCLVVWSQVAEQSWVGVDWLEWRGGEDVIKISCAVDCGALMTAIGGKTRAPNGVKERLGGREGTTDCARSQLGESSAWKFTLNFTCQSIASTESFSRSQQS